VNGEGRPLGAARHPTPGNVKATVTDRADVAQMYRRRRRSVGPAGDPLDDLAGLPAAGDGQCCRTVLDTGGHWRPCCPTGAAG
jgi:hypothetical protein